MRLHPSPGGADARWCGDITYIRTWEGWLFLATVIDLASRRVVGWATADHLRTHLVEDALRQAPPRRRPPAGVVFHSDQGCLELGVDLAHVVDARARSPRVRFTLRVPLLPVVLIPRQDQNSLQGRHSH